LTIEGVAKTAAPFSFSGSFVTKAVITPQEWKKKMIDMSEENRALVVSQENKGVNQR
jgi:hypothetical protein